MNPYTPANPSGLYNGPALGPNWTGYLADNGAGGGSNQQRDAGTNGANANGQPTPYVEQHPAWLQIAAGMCLAPGLKVVVNLLDLANKLESEAPKVDANRFNHIFDKAEHNLGPLVERLGSQEATFAAVQRATEAAVKRGGISDVFETTVDVAGQNVVVRGRVIEGVPRIGTFFIP
jgi:hypothetical protein